ncbi:chlorite dismutase family protein [Luteipulveratus sp. YIM 133132]|uniref:Coproheme decarboxylase n=1 Tax=Luteipulveratus flavus TaxID=3031728 RepID=A0ABT6CAS7_9MICO|nr:MULTISPECIES: hydrogen peroxide-dependent heme synthase [unclassified Luteipulveratus]MDE9366833.1 chlorite dismutase family protein [Luteipulveratus sp. YIM 133132]MDF8265866.1 chlorite dismutase family protein [Luteipulveratus sp. YIM 133296]
MTEDTEQATALRPGAKKINEINDTIRYTMYSVFRVARELPRDRGALLEEAQRLLDGLPEQGVVVRGVYDVGGLRADSDLMIWWHAEDIESLQAAYRAFLATELGRHLEPFWSNAALHRPAEFNRSHIPAFLAEERTRKYVCVYPFVRSYDWYLLPEEERRTMLKDHGVAARDYPDVRANTVASFALGDYEWILAFEADELHRIVDLMRDLRATEARRHVREEIPFFTGPRVELADLVARLR